MNRMRRFASLFGRRGVLAAAAAALIVLGVQVIQQILSALLYGGLMMAQGSVSGGAFGVVWGIVFGSLPFVIGVFLSLWLLAPVAAELRLAHVITRSLLATAMGAVAVFVVMAIGSLFSNFNESAGLVFGWASGLLSTVSSNFGWALSNAVLGALGTAIALIPLTVLAGILLWIWLREHPAQHPVAGLIDEV
ncbi:MAG: hypothetical protein ABI238_04605 [Terrimesophilobacter sp.]